ncbi:hypothetical protein RB8356 [Rhodopirellula baltica SH 1]|uniref:Uncharacterized protein n=1 Tax=Rhodopirellula baltica (strain DSM 10527 / NCIMB 13988 / SH1) TaxID=243090 RepID=Q7UFT3_RHOBA|nr:hypothetical protein RB8356 [Rhodopirellula baltica SH 1]
MTVSNHIHDNHRERWRRIRWHDSAKRAAKKSKWATVSKPGVKRSTWAVSVPRSPAVPAVNLSPTCKKFT